MEASFNPDGEKTAHRYRKRLTTWYLKTIEARLLFFFHRLEFGLDGPHRRFQIRHKIGGKRDALAGGFPLALVIHVVDAQINVPATLEFLDSRPHLFGWILPYLRP